MTSTNPLPLNQVAFVRTTREFPSGEVYELAREMNRGWIELANAINNRVISIFPTTKPVQTGESWFLNSTTRNQSLRQVYTFTSVANPVDLGFKINTFPYFTRCFGEFTDNSTGNWYGLINGTDVAIAGQISFYIKVNGASTTSDQIAFLTGAGAPAFSEGIITIEWLSQV